MFKIFITALLASVTAQAAYNPQNPNGQATGANSSPVVVASDQMVSQSNVVVSGTLTASDAVVGAPIGDGTLLSGASTAGFVYAVVPDTFVAWTLLIKGYVSGTIYTEASNNTTNGTDGDWVEVKGRRTGTAPGTESVVYAMSLTVTTEAMLRALKLFARA